MNLNKKGWSEGLKTDNFKDHDKVPPTPGPGGWQKHEKRVAEGCQGGVQWQKNKAAVLKGGGRCERC